MTDAPLLNCGRTTGVPESEAGWASLAAKTGCLQDTLFFLNFFFKIGRRENEKLKNKGRKD